MKLKTLTSTTGFIAIAIVSLILIGLVAALGSSAQFDLTENKLYTLSEGTRAVVSKLEKPVKLHLFFSQSESRDLPELRSYARRVEETLQEMVEINPKKLSLKTVDPQAFSEQEDQAAEFGLQSVPIRPGKTLYFGLVAEDEKGTVQTIGFLQPDRETVLEYEVAQMIYRLGRSEAPQIGLMSSINMMGEFNFMSPGAAKPWIVVEQLQQLFDVKKLNPGDAIPKELATLIVVQPQSFEPKVVAAIEQYALNGGHLLMLVDPVSSAQPPGAEPPARESVEKLLKHWGLNVALDKVVLDLGTALKITPNGAFEPVMHLAVSGLRPDNMNRSDVLTQKLNVINTATAAPMTIEEKTDFEVTPLIHFSDKSGVVDASKVSGLDNPQELMRFYKPEDQKYVLAARTQGKASAILQISSTADEKSTDDKKETDSTKSAPVSKSKKSITALVITDSDFLTDPLWVNVRDFFGQRVAQPFAENGEFFQNAVDQMSGSSDLVSIRSRSQFARPFTKVEQLRQKAGEAFMTQERELNKRLQETEAKLADLQASPDGNAVKLNAEQEQALLQFQSERLKIRKQLREVQHRLNQDIDDLGRTLKLINIVGVPFLLIICVVIFVTWRRHRLAQATV